MTDIPNLLDIPFVNSVLHFLNGKKVFIFDTETTGLPDRVPGGKWGTSSEYWNYTLNNKYDNSRIVSIAWAFCNEFDRNKCIKQNNNNNNIEELIPIKNFIRYPEDFNDIPTTHIHGISFETAILTGIPFYDIFEKYGLYEDLITTEYIIAHNVNFDIHILLNELYRIGENGSIKAREVIKHIDNLMMLGHCICTGELGKDLCKLEYKYNTSKYNKTTTANIAHTANIVKKQKVYKMPKLIELYNHFYKCDFKNAHSADGDVRALLMCLGHM